MWKIKCRLVTFARLVSSGENREARCGHHGRHLARAAQTHIQHPFYNSASKIRAMIAYCRSKERCSGCHRGLCLAVGKRKSDYALWRH